MKRYRTKSFKDALPENASASDAKRALQMKSLI